QLQRAGHPRLAAEHVLHHLRERDRAAGCSDPGLRLRNPHVAVHQRSREPSLTHRFFKGVQSWMSLLQSSLVPVSPRSASAPPRPASASSSDRSCRVQSAILPPLTASRGASTSASPPPSCSA